MVTDPVKRQIAKALLNCQLSINLATFLCTRLMLNCLYGRFGMKDIVGHMKIILNEEAIKLTHKYNFDILAKMNDKYTLIRYKDRIPESLRKIIKEAEVDMIEQENFGLDQSKEKLPDSKELVKERGVPSAIQIAAAISGYAAASMFKYLNIEGNICHYSDTDSAVLSKELPADLVGKEIGQMKLEYVISKAVYARPKLYSVETKDGRLIKKAVGMNSRQLTFPSKRLFRI